MKKNNNAPTNFTSETLHNTPETGTIEVSKTPAAEPQARPQTARLEPLVYRVEEIAQLLAISSRAAYNLELLTKYTKAISYGIIEKTRKDGQNAAQNPYGDHRRSHAARPLSEEVGKSA